MRSDGSIISALTVALCVAIAGPGLAQGSGSTWIRPFPAASWCEDTATACWRDPARHVAFNGIRVLADLDLSNLIQAGTNRFEGGLNGFPKVGVETNLWNGWVGVQAGLMVSGAITLDDRSPAVQQLREELRGERRTRVDHGWLFGMSFLDGTIGAGWGLIDYDRRDFVQSDTLKRDVLRDSFLYISLQPIASIRAVIKRNKTSPGTEPPDGTP